VKMPHSKRVFSQTSATISSMSASADILFSTVAGSALSS